MVGAFRVAGENQSGKRTIDVNLSCECRYLSRKNNNTPKHPHTTKLTRPDYRKGVFWRTVINL